MPHDSFRRPPGRPHSVAAPGENVVVHLDSYLPADEQQARIARLQGRPVKPGRLQVIPIDPRMWSTVLKCAQREYLRECREKGETVYENPLPWSRDPDWRS